jgi:hypothetical protein
MNSESTVNSPVKLPENEISRIILHTIIDLHFFTIYALNTDIGKFMQNKSFSILNTIITLYLKSANLFCSSGAPSHRLFLNYSNKRKGQTSEPERLNSNSDNFIIIVPFISFSSLSYDRSKTSSKASSPHSAIQSFLFQMRVSSPFLKVIQ